MNQLLAEIEWNGTQDAKGTIDQPPPERNAAQVPEHQRPRDDERAGDQPEINQPTVPHRVTPGANERDRDDDVSEGQPVGAVEQRRVLLGGGVK